MRIINTVILLIVMVSTADAFLIRERIFDNQARHESVDVGDGASPNSHACWDGTNLWFATSVVSSDTHTMVKYTPSTNAMTTKALASDDTDASAQAYEVYCDPDDSDIMWVQSAYVTFSDACRGASIWKYDTQGTDSVADDTSDYYEGVGYVYSKDSPQTNSSGRIVKFTATNPDPDETYIVGTLSNGALYFFDTSDNTFAPYTLENYTYLYAFGLDTDGYNLFIAGDFDSAPGEVWVVHNDFQTDGTVSIGDPEICALNHTKIDSNDYVTHTGAAGVIYIGLVYDSSETCLWLSGWDGTENCIWKLPLTYTGNYVTGFGSVTKYQSGNTDQSSMPDITFNSDYVASVYEGTSVGEAGFMLLDRNDSNAVITVGPGPNFYPYKENQWIPTSIELGYSGYAYIGGWNPDTGSVTAFRLLEVVLSERKTRGLTLNGGTIQ